MSDDKLVKKCRDARANGDPAKYLAGLTVADAHEIARRLSERDSMEGEIERLAINFLDFWEQEPNGAVTIRAAIALRSALTSSKTG